MPRVILQAGHYPLAGGAPGEAEWTWKLANLIKPHLTGLGVDVPIVGDFLNLPAPAAVTQEAALFVALHYDAAIYGAGNNTGCFADTPATDAVATLSKRAVAHWEAVYPARVGIPLRNGRRNANTWNYYAYRALTPRTPAMLIEHGVGSPIPYGGYPAGQDAATLHNRIADVAAADAHAIADYLRATGQLTPLPPEEPVITPDQQTLLDAAARQTEAGNTIRHGGDLDWWLGTWHQLAGDKESLAQLLQKAQSERDGYMAKVGELERALANATQPVTSRIARIQNIVIREDGSTEEFQALPL